MNNPILSLMRNNFLFLDCLLLFLLLFSSFTLTSTNHQPTMARLTDQDEDDNSESDNEEVDENGVKEIKKRTTRLKKKQLGISCMLNTEVGAVLAVIRRTPDSNSLSSEDNYDSSLLNSLKSLRAFIFNPQQEWHTIDPSVYLSPFLDVVQSDDIPAAATGVALSAILKILKLEIFNENTPGSRDAINSIVSGVESCRLERTDSASEEAVLMRILQVLIGIVRHCASFMLTDHAVCTLVNTCFQVVKQSASRGDLLQTNARHTMHELIQAIFARLPQIQTRGETPEPGGIEDDDDGSMSDGYGARCMVDIFHFLCSLLNVVEVEYIEGSTSTNSDEEVQLFALILINSAIELSGDGIRKHPKLLKMVQDDLFHYLIHYGMCSVPLVLSMICSIVLNIYHFLRRYVRLQLEAFFTYVLLRVVDGASSPQLQEVALEGIISFCRQPTFTIEMYVNYDCHPVFRNMFQDIGKLLCKIAFPLANNPLTSLQILAFEGLLKVIHHIADNIDEDDEKVITTAYPIDIKDYKPFYLGGNIHNENLGTWVESLRLRKAQKKKIVIAANHFNRDEKKGLDYLKITNIITDPPHPRAFAFFFRFTPGLDKNKIGDFLGDPDEFYLEVLKEFTDTFNFNGMILDSALRTYLETFRLPGESQKIQRILEAFSEKFYDQQTSDIFVSKDAVFILCYSLIMLNTDQHNPQVKKKMTEEEFIRNNRAINGGKDLPREYLSELFQSIATNAITIFGQTGTTLEMNPNRWTDLLNRAKVMEPFVLCNFTRSLGRDMFASMSGTSVATLSTIFEHAEEDETLNECVEGMFSIARIARFGLEDTLDELLASFCKFTLLLNPYATAEETIYSFSNEIKPRMSTLAVFTIANKFGDSIRGGWRNIVDCLLKLKRLKLLPQSIVEQSNDASSLSSSDVLLDSKSESGVIFPSLETALHSSRRSSSFIGRFSHFLSIDCTEETLAQGGGEFEQNLKIIQQCRIGNIFSNSSNLHEESLRNLGRSLIFAAAGKGQKFSTPVEEEETVGFCWDLIITITMANVQRFLLFWPSFHDYLILVAQFPLFSACPFAEKAIAGLFKVCLKLLALEQPEKLSEELIFKSINLMWKLDKEILDNDCEMITQSVNKILTELPANLQSQLGWKSVLHLLSVIGRHPGTFDQGVEALISLLSDGTHVSRMNYGYCIDCAFGFAALKISPPEKSWKILDLMAESVNLLIQWYRSGYSDPGSNTSNCSSEDGSNKNLNQTMNLFIKLVESLRKTSLVRREEIRNHAVSALQRSFSLADELCFTSTNCLNCFNLVIFAMVDDLHEKLVEYSRRDNSIKEMKSMAGTLKIGMELLKEVFLQFLKPISQSSGFRTFWLGVLRRMDTCMKTELGDDEEESRLKELIPVLLKEMITEMKEKEILVQKEDNDLWDITHIQIQWIAPSLKEELFPEEVI